MGGKRLKFPKRKKFIPQDKGIKDLIEEKDEINSEEHEARLKILKDLGLIK